MRRIATTMRVLYANEYLHVYKPPDNINIHIKTSIVSPSLPMLLSLDYHRQFRSGQERDYLYKERMKEEKRRISVTCVLSATSIEDAQDIIIEH